MGSPVPRRDFGSDGIRAIAAQSAGVGFERRLRIAGSRVESPADGYNASQEG